MAVVEVSQHVDARGLSCPMPIVKTAQAIKTVASGELIEVLATDLRRAGDIEFQKRAPPLPPVCGR